MWRSAWKSVLGHKGRLILSVIAVALGAAFMVGALTFTGMISQVFTSLTKGTIPDVQVGAKGAFDQSSVGNVDEPRPISASSFDAIGKVGGVEKVEGSISSLGIYPLNAAGKVTAIGAAPAMGFSWMDSPAFNHQPGLVVKNGQAPHSDDEVAVDPNTLASLKKSIGDQVDIVLADGTKLTKKIVGTANWGSGGTVGAQYTFFTVHEAQRLFLDGQDAYQSVWVTVDQGADRAQVAAEVNKVLPSGFEALDGQKLSEDMANALQQGLSFINTFLMVFAIIGLVVAIFLIINTFSILVAQRGRELALYRALGASKGQVQRTVIIEALITGLIGSVIGIVLGALLAFGISLLLGVLGMDLGDATPIPSLSTILAALAVGTVVTVISAWLPAVQAGRVAPVAAMTGQTERHRTTFGFLEAATSVLLVVGAVLLGIGVAGKGPNPVLFIGIGALAMLVGVAGVAPLLGRPLTWVMGRIFRAMFKAPGKLADLNIARQPRRTASTAAALMIGLTLVTTLGILGNSASASISKIVRDTMRADFQITSVNFLPLSKNVEDAVSRVDGVDQTFAVRHAYTQFADSDSSVSIAGFQPQAFGKFYAQQIVAGQPFTDSIGEIIVSKQQADERNWKVGEQVGVKNPKDATTFNLTIVGIYDVPKGAATMGAINTNLTTLAALGNSDKDSNIYVLTKPGTDKASVKTALDQATKDFPTVSVTDRDAYAKQQTSQINNLLNMIYALLGLAIVIAILGIVNTLVLSTIERTREIGLLRAVGLQRSQLRRMISLESVTMAVLGAVLGMALGLIFGSALRASLADSGLATLVIPWVQLAAFLVASVIVGLLAAIWPGHRAAQMNVLQAIASE